jgi:hypothetical protein
MTSLAAVFRALRFHGGSADDLAEIHAKDWPEVLNRTDRAQLTLPLGVRRGSSLPETARARIDQSLGNNKKRYAAMRAAQCEIADHLRARGVEFLVLKGLSQSPWYNDDPRHRPQYDIDLYCPDGAIAMAAEAIRTLGYEPAGTGGARTDHLTVMIRKTGWTWRGDYYDPEMPPSVELHFRFWDPQTEGFDIAGLDGFWRRRVVREVDGLVLPTLKPVDGLSYSTMHLVRHLLRGDLRPGHVYELAHFLERSAGENEFWREWRDRERSPFRIAERIAFRLAAEWFCCQLNPAAHEAIDDLPGAVKRWFDLFAFSTASDRPNKNELWLHLCLVESARVRRRIALRRFLPARRAHVVADAHIPDARAGIRLRMRRLVFAVSFLTQRALFHAGTLLPTIRSGWIWWRTRES